MNHCKLSTHLYTEIAAKREKVLKLTRERAEGKLYTFASNYSSTPRKLKESK